jgi:hypothetical protein
MENSMRVDDVSTHSDIHENIDIDEIDVGIQIPENVSDIESNITSPKDDEDSKHKAYEKYFLHITDEDVQIDSVLSWFNGEPATGKFYVFKRRKDAQQIIDNLKKDGKQAVILGKSIRYSSKKK